MKRGKQSYFAKYFKRNLKNIKNTWKEIKIITSMRSSSSITPTLVTFQNKTIDYPVKIAIIFNNDTPIDSYFFYRIYLFSFVCTYFYLLESLLIYDNLFLFRIICKNLFLFMMICKNLFHLFSSVRNSFYLLSFVRIYFINHISGRSSEMPFLKE